MARKFISFLGTGNYQPCKYKLNDKVSAEVTFIQEVLIDFLCQNFDENDAICIFLQKRQKQNIGIIYTPD